MERFHEHFGGLKVTTEIADPWTMVAGEDLATVPSRPIVPRQPLKGTPQQEAFWDELLTGNDHVVLEARAGTGKSTSCREGMWRLLDEFPDHSIRYCCFNKAIADEFAVKAPPGVDVGTMHRFGHQALNEQFRCQLDQYKTYTVLDGIGGKGLKRYVRKAISTLVGLAKNHAIRPDDPKLEQRLHEFVVYYDVETWRQLPEVVRWAKAVLATSAEMTTVIDFDDMLWLSVIHQVRFPGIDDLFIDEAQDLSPVQHELAELLSASGRTVVVGDPYQAIYGFRGADSDSMPKLRQKLAASVMPLTVTFRCPRSHVELARQLVPDFEAAPEAPEGILRNDVMEAIDRAQPGELVLCRANAPIISACLRQIADLTPAVVRGRAIGDSLLSLHRKLEAAPTIPEYVRSLSIWRAGELARLEAKDGSETAIEQLWDKTASLDAIASACASPSEVPTAIATLFSDDRATNRVTFSSVHRAKGSEARSVIYIQVPYGEKRDRERPPQPWELQQRRNLRYVAVTRSLHSLTLVSQTR